MRRFLLILLIVPVAGLALAASQWLLSGVYSNIARHPDTPEEASIEASRIAADIAPWRAQAHTEYARQLIVGGRPADAVLAEFRHALNWSPADGFLWLDYSQILAHQHHFGSELTLAATRVNQLGPTTSQLQFGNAMIGVYYWYQAPMPVQQQWTRSMSWALGHQPKRFLNTIVGAKKMYWFCASAALELPLGKWCGYMWDAYEQGLMPQDGPLP